MPYKWKIGTTQRLLMKCKGFKASWFWRSKTSIIGETQANMAMIWLIKLDQVGFKICSTVYKALHDLSLSYIMEMMALTTRIPRRQDLRSASRCDLIIPKYNIKFAERAFVVPGPMAWNRLPLSVRDAPLLTTFHCLLKTDLLQIGYPDSWLCTVPLQS